MSSSSSFYLIACKLLRTHPSLFSTLPYRPRLSSQTALAQSSVSRTEAVGRDGGVAPSGAADDQQKDVLVQAEVQRMKRLPSASVYATHRLKVLDKLLQLLSKARTQTETDELELLFANMSF